MGLMDLFGRKNTPVQRQRPARGEGLTTEQLRAELVTLRRELNADFVMYVESTFEIPGRGTALHGWLTGDLYLHVSTGRLQDWQSLNTIVPGIGPVAIEDRTGLSGRAEAGDGLLSVNVLLAPQRNPERLHGALYIGNGKLSQQAQAQQPVNVPRPASPAPAPQPTQAAPQQNVKNELLNVIVKKDLLFAMKVISAVNGRMGTVLTGSLLGRARKGGITAWVTESGSGREMSGDMEILGLKQDGQLVEQLESGMELFNCSVLVPAMTDPGQAVGNILCGGYRTEQPPYAAELMDDLERLMHHLGSKFAFSIRQAHDLGPNGTGLVGYLLGQVKADEDYVCLYDKERDEFLSGPMQVSRLNIRRVEEKSLRSLNSLLGCGIVVKGNLSEDVISGRLVVLVECKPEELDNW